MSGDGGRTVVPSLWRNRDFTLLWGSQTLSNLGSSINSLATPLLVLALTHSPVRAGVVGTVGLVVELVLRAPSGVLVDRLDRRRLLLACDAVRLVAVGVLALAVLGGYASVGLILAVGVVNAAGYAMFDTAERAALRSLVGAAQASTAVARNEARS